MRHSSKHIVYGTEGLEVVHDGHHLASTAPQVLPYGSELAQRGAGLEVAPFGLEVTPYGSEQAQRGAGLQAVQPGLILCDEEKLGGLERSSSSLSSASSDSVGKEKVLPPRPKDGRICGFRRKPFFVLLAFAIFMVLALALGLGLGLMFGLQRAANPTPNPTPTTMTTAANTSTISSLLTTTATNNATATTTTGTTSTATSTQSIGVSASAPANTATKTATATTEAAAALSTGASGDCPAANNTLIVASRRNFRIMCNFDIAGGTPNAIQKQSQSDEGSFADCIATCASQNLLQARSDISARFLTTNGAGGICECLGGLPANAARKFYESGAYWLAVIQ